MEKEIEKENEKKTQRRDAKIRVCNELLDEAKEELEEDKDYISAINNLSWIYIKYNYSFKEDQGIKILSPNQRLKNAFEELVNGLQCFNSYASLDDDDFLEIIDRLGCFLRNKI